MLFNFYITSLKSKLITVYWSLIRLLCFDQCIFLTRDALFMTWLTFILSKKSKSKHPLNLIYIYYIKSSSVIAISISFLERVAPSGTST